MTQSDLRVNYRIVPGIGGWKRNSHVPSETVAFARDHLLKIARHQYKETYKRFHFRDITAVVVSDMPQTGLMVLLGVINTVVLLFVWMAGAGSLVALPSKGGALLFGFMAFILTVISLAILETAPTCRTVIRTSTSAEELPSIRRWTHAQRFVAELSPLVRAAQGADAPPMSAGRSVLGEPSGPTPVSGKFST